MQLKTKKRLRGIPVLYDEKKHKYTLMLTPTAWKQLQALAVDAGLSSSELMERTIRAMYNDGTED